MTEAQALQITLYHMRYSRSMTTLWMLEELGVRYRVRLVEREREKREPGYLQINPLNKVPALEHGEKVITEAAAICVYLAEAFPSSGLNIAVDDPLRGDYLKWCFFAPSCIEPAIIERMAPRQDLSPASTGWGDFDRLIQYISTQLGKSAYILGERFTTADVLVGSQLGWGAMMGFIPRTAEIAAYLERLDSRPARQRAFKMDKEENWPTA